MILLISTEAKIISYHAGESPPKLSKHPHELDETVGGIITSYI